MFVKRFKRKCSVRGCKNTENVFVLSKRREMGNTIAMCRDCMKDALASTENYVEPVKVKREDKPLFPHPELEVTISSVADNEPKPIEVIEEVETTEEIPELVTEDIVTIDEKTEEKPKNTTTKAKTTNNKKKSSKR